MRGLCLNTAETLWQNKLAVEFGQLDVNGMAYASGFHALCAYCDWNTDCPKFHDAEFQPEWQTDLQKLADLKNSRSALDAEIEEMETGLKEAYALTGMVGDWINTGSYRFRVSKHPGRRTLDREALRLELLDALGDEHAAEKLLSWCEVEGNPYSRLTITPIHSIH